MERAQALSSVRIVSREQRDAIAEAIGGFRFTTAFGRTLSRYVRAGIGVHHAGMLPRYRRLVETLAQRGLLRVICGTDTLGVGINVPIRTVLLTALTKYDGQRMRQLSAREFHQIAGRAGRAGYDTAGTVVVMAPEHEIENAAAVAKAGDDPKKLRKIVRKKAPQGFVNWGEATFERLVAAEPEPLAPQLQLTAAMLINVIARGGDVFANVRSLVFDNHEPRARQYELARRALGIFRTLSRPLVVVDVDARRARIRLTVELQPNFALNQPLSPFALAAIELLDPDDAPGAAGTGHYALDVVSVIEATLDDPRPVLSQQQFLARGEAVAAMKREGIEYDERMELLEEITYPKPLEELLAQSFEVFASSQPWVRDFELSPKSVVRDMFERALSFGEFISFYQLARSEGLVLRYLSDAYRAIRQTVPAEAQTSDLLDLVEWLGELVRQVDSSLVDEWEALVNPVDRPGRAGRAAGPAVGADEPAGVPRAACATSCSAACSSPRCRRTTSSPPSIPTSTGRRRSTRYFDEHDEILTGGPARSPRLVDDRRDGCRGIRRLAGRADDRRSGRRPRLAHPRRRRPRRVRGGRHRRAARHRGAAAVGPGAAVRRADASNVPRAGAVRRARRGRAPNAQREPRLRAEAPRRSQRRRGDPSAKPPSESRDLADDPRALVGRATRMTVRASSAGRPARAAERSSGSTPASLDRAARSPRGRSRRPTERGRVVNQQW